MTHVRYVSASRVQDLKRILNARDIAIVETVAQLRFVSGAQLRRIHVSSGTALGNERVARKLLARLVELGVLDRLERRIGGPGPGGSEGYIYVLALGGQSLVHKRQMSARSRRRRVTAPGQMFVSHTLALAEIHTRLIEAERDGRWVIQERLAEPACWRRFTIAQGEQSILKPDLAVRVAHDERRQSFLIDVDRGTEGTRTLERRLRIYGQYREHLRGSERRFPQVLWLARTDKRVRVIAGALGCLPEEASGYFHVARFERAIEAITRLL
ncbi:MAG TPA: replication-relaxation family protein [Solirubrobacteraceae bacterium]|jgi:hypothetical protein